MKQIIRLTEGDLHRIIENSVRRVLKENDVPVGRYDEFEEEEFIDRKGNPIQKGSKVIWYDPERSARDLKRVWTVYDMGGDIVYIADGHGETEVFPQELEVVG